MKSIPKAGESERICGEVCQECRLCSFFPHYFADVLCLVGVAVPHRPSFLRLCNHQPTTNVLQVM